MTDAGMTAMAEAMHAAEVEADQFTPAAVKDELAALRARDDGEMDKLFEVTAEIETELEKTGFKSRVAEFKMQM